MKDSLDGSVPRQDEYRVRLVAAREGQLGLEGVLHVRNDVDGSWLAS